MVAQIGEAVAELVAVDVDLAAVFGLCDGGAVAFYDPVPVRHRHTGLKKNLSLFRVSTKYKIYLIILIFHTNGGLNP